jgi:hypothetical protein
MCLGAVTGTVSHRLDHCFRDVGAAFGSWAIATATTIAGFPAHDGFTPEIPPALSKTQG